MMTLTLKCIPKWDDGDGISSMPLQASTRQYVGENNRKGEHRESQARKGFLYQDTDHSS